MFKLICKVRKNTLLCHILYHKSCQGKPENSRYMCHCAVDLGFLWVCWVLFCGGGWWSTFVIEYFGRKYAKVFLGGEHLSLSHTLTHSRTQRTAIDLPKLGYPYLGKVEFEGTAHRRKKDSSMACRLHRQQYLIFQTVDTVDDIVVSVEVKLLFGLLVEKTSYCLYLGIGVDVEQSATKHLYLPFAYGRGCRHYLTVDIAGTNIVVIDNIEIPHSATDKAFGTPTAYTAHPEDNHPLRCERLHHVVSNKKSAPLKYFVHFDSLELVVCYSLFAMKLITILLTFSIMEKLIICRLVIVLLSCRFLMLNPINNSLSRNILPTFGRTHISGNVALPNIIAIPQNYYTIFFTSL